MRAAIVILTIAGLGAMAFAYWGLYTPSGQASYDEMDGLIPFFAGVAGVALVAVALLLAVIRIWRSRKAG